MGATRLGRPAVRGPGCPPIPHTGPVVLAIICVLVGLVVGRVSGGRFALLGELPLRHARLLVAAVVAQLLGAVGQALLPSPGDGVAAVAGLLASAGLVAAFLALNRRLAGLGLIAAGLLCNAAALAANGARMPVSVSAAARAGLAVLPLEIDGRHREATAATRLRPLTDVIPVSLPGHPLVASPGDLLVAAGAGLLVVRGMRPQRSAAAHRLARTPPPG